MTVKGQKSTTTGGRGPITKSSPRRPVWDDGTLSQKTIDWMARLYEPLSDAGMSVQLIRKLIEDNHYNEDLIQIACNEVFESRCAGEWKSTDKRKMTASTQTKQLKPRATRKSKNFDANIKNSQAKKPKKSKVGKSKNVPEATVSTVEVEVEVELEKKDRDSGPKQMTWADRIKQKERDPAPKRTQDSKPVKNVKHEGEPAGQLTESPKVDITDEQPPGQALPTSSNDESEPVLSESSNLQEIADVDEYELGTNIEVNTPENSARTDTETNKTEVVTQQAIPGYNPAYPADGFTNGIPFGAYGIYPANQVDMMQAFAQGQQWSFVGHPGIAAYGQYPEHFAQAFPPNVPFYGPVAKPDASDAPTPPRETVEAPVLPLPTFAPFPQVMSPYGYQPTYPGFPVSPSEGSTFGGGYYVPTQPSVPSPSKKDVVSAETTSEIPVPVTAQPNAAFLGHATFGPIPGYPLMSPYPHYFYPQNEQVSQHANIIPNQSSAPQPSPSNVN